MGFVNESHGRNLISVEKRRESFIIHPAYGYDKEGNVHSDYIRTSEGEELRKGFAQRWREEGHPEFLLEDVPDLVRALADLPTCPPEVKKALGIE